jgi:hypothetical protein
MTQSQAYTKIAIATLKTTTNTVAPNNSCLVGQLTFIISERTSFRYWISFCIVFTLKQVWRDLNPQPMVLETTTLPIELQTYVIKKNIPSVLFNFPQHSSVSLYILHHIALFLICDPSLDEPSH